MKTKLIFGSLATFFAVSCATATEPADYSLNVKLTPDEDGMVLYLTDFDSQNKIDSAIVNNGEATFSGKLDKSYRGRLLLEGERIGDIFVEPVNMTYEASNNKFDSYGTLNKRFEAMSQELGSLVNQFRQLPADSANQAERQKIFEQYNAVMDKTMNDNADNALGLLIFTENAMSMDLSELNQALEKYPQFKNSARVQKAISFLKIKEETSVGHKYKDFTIVNGDKKQSLSDYVGNGHYTLVDFWASWCGPCIRETQTIKKLYEKYNGKGLEFLGVAVWDKPENTEEAIKKHNLPWNMIINAQTIPTDLYGIQGIPCIILIAPDGTIVSRDKQGDDLVADVEAAMSQINKE